MFRRDDFRHIGVARVIRVTKVATFVLHVKVGGVQRAKMSE